MPDDRERNVDDVSGRIRRITEELRALQDEFYWAALSDPKDREIDKLVGEMLDFNVVADLKSAVDQLRHLLWAYIEVCAERDKAAATYMEQSTRLARATELLRLLRQRFTDTIPEPIDGPSASFLEQMNSLIGHLEDKQKTPPPPPLKEK